MGSRAKVATIFKRLRKRGTPEEALARVRSPIGLAIGAETPEEIAVSIVAELVQVRRARGKEAGDHGRRPTAMSESSTV